MEGRKARKRPWSWLTFANVTALLALFIVLGGTGVASPIADTAASLGSSVKKALKLSKNANNKADRALKLATEANQNAASVKAKGGLPGPQGAPGAPGAPGPPGPPGQGGQAAKKLFFEGPPDTASTPILEVAGLKLNAGCNEAGEPIFTAETTQADAQIKVFENEGTSIEGGSNENFDPDEPFDLLVSSTSGSGNVVYSRSGGTVVTVVFAYDDAPTYGTEDVCTVVGTALQG